MPSQDDFDSAFNTALYEEIEPPENAAAGQLKTKNPTKSDPWQRTTVHTEDAESPYKKTVKMILCVHGFDTPKHEVPMTLMVFHFHLNCADKGSRYKSARIWFRFNDHAPVKGTTAPTNPASAEPTIASWAPLSKTADSSNAARWKATTAAIEKTDHTGGSLGADYMVSGTLERWRENSIAFERSYFSRGYSNPIDDEETDRSYGVEFYLEQNSLQDDGVEPDFQVAVLLTRSKTAPEAPFDLRFAMRVEGGSQHDLKEGTRRFFRFGKPEDEPVWFEPTRGPKAVGDYGEELLKLLEIEEEKEGRKVKVDLKENMKRLQQGRRLALFSDLPGLRPLDPKQLSG